MFRKARQPVCYPTWDCAWMLGPSAAGGGASRNLGPHRVDMFLHLTGEEAKVTRASGVLGTIEVGNGFPRIGTDGDSKLAGRDAILTMKDGVVKLANASDDRILPAAI